MIMEIISFVRDNLGSFLDSTSPENSCLQPDLDQALPPTNQDQKRLLLIELDHMRDVKGYSQTLAKWTKQLGLSGRLVFTRGYQLPRGVLILVIGEECQTREFEKRLRTTKVDVDSQGRPCKEKMLRILCCRDWDVSEAEESSRGTLITSSLEELVVAMPELSEVLDQHVKK